MGLLKSIAKVGLAPSAFVATQILKGVGLVTGKDYGPTKQILGEAVETTTGKVIGGAIAATGTALVAATAATTTAGIAITSAVTKAAKAVAKIIPAPVKASLTTAAVTGGTIAVLAPETTKVITSSPEALKTTAAYAIGGPTAGIVVGLEQGTGLISEAISENAPKIAETIKEAAPYVGAAALTTAAVIGATSLIDKEEIILGETTSPVTANQTQIVPATTGESLTAEAPVLPETQAITATTGAATTKKRRRKAQPSKISQSVRLNIINSNSYKRTTKRYLNVIPITN